MSPTRCLLALVAEEECWIVLVGTVTTKHTGDVTMALTRSIEEQLA